MREDVDEEKPLWLQPGCNIPQKRLHSSRPCTLTKMNSNSLLKLNASPMWSFITRIMVLDMSAAAMMTPEESCQYL